MEIQHLGAGPKQLPPPSTAAADDEALLTSLAAASASERPLFAFAVFREGDGLGAERSTCGPYGERKVSRSTYGDRTVDGERSTYGGRATAVASVSAAEASVSAAERETLAQVSSLFAGARWDASVDERSTAGERATRATATSGGALDESAPRVDLELRDDGLVRLVGLSEGDALAECGVLRAGDVLLRARRAGEREQTFGADLAAASRLLLRPGEVELTVLGGGLEELGLHRRPADGDRWWLRRVAVISDFAGADLGLRIARPCGTRALRGKDSQRMGGRRRSTASSRRSEAPSSVT